VNENQSTTKEAPKMKVDTYKVMTARHVNWTIGEELLNATPNCDDRYAKLRRMIREVLDVDMDGEEVGSVDDDDDHRFPGPPPPPTSDGIGTAVDEEAIGGQVGFFLIQVTANRILKC